MTTPTNPTSIARTPANAEALCAQIHPERLRRSQRNALQPRNTLKTRNEYKSLLLFFRVFRGQESSRAEKKVMGCGTDGDRLELLGENLRKSAKICGSTLSGSAHTPRATRRSSSAPSGFCFLRFCVSAFSRKSSPFDASARAFTLVELVVAMAIFVILLAMAVPVFRGITGTRSIASGTNVLSAFTNRVRMDAIGAQDYRGIMFFLDQNTGRIGMVELKPVGYAPSFVGVPSGFTAWGLDKADVWLDLADTEPTLLPSGVGASVLSDAPVGGTRYIGFPSNFPFSGTRYTNRPGGCIMFDANGRLALNKAGMVWMDNGGAMTDLGRFMFGGGTFTLASFSNIRASSWGAGQLALTMFDSTEFEEHCRGQGMTDPWMNDLNADGTLKAAEADKQTWLDNNATPMLINRYNGTLIKGE